MADIGRARSFLAALEALAVERIRIACEEEARLAIEHATGGPKRFGGDVGHALAVSEVAVAEGISEWAAARLLTASEALCGPQMAVLSRLEGGILSEAHARVITEQTATLPIAVAEEFGIECLRRLETRTGRKRTSGEFRAAVRDLRERLHPDSIRTRKVRAVQDRGVWVRPEPDGMCTVNALLPAEVGLAAVNRVDALARAAQRVDPEDGRTLPQLRADALSALILGTVQVSGSPASEALDPASEAPVPASEAPVHSVGVPAPAAEIVVHVTAGSLLGLSHEPAVLEGYGPIDAKTARELAVATATWQMLSVGSDGVPLSLGRTAYRPPKRLRRFIEYRDGTCQFPLCSSPAWSAEIDHITEWQDGGTTDADNLQLLCRKHHALKSLRLWKSTRLKAGAGQSCGEILWISPLGARTVSGPVGRELGAGDSTGGELTGSEPTAANGDGQGPPDPSPPPF